MPAGSSFARLRWPGMRQAGIVSVVAYDTFEPVPRWHRGMPSSWLTLIVTVGEPVLLHGSAPSPNQPWPHSTSSVLPTCLAGLHHRATAVRVQGRQTGVQLALDPVAAPRLLGLPAAELAGAGVEAEAALGPALAQLRERLAHSRDLDDLSGAAQQWAATAYRPDGRAGRPEVAHAWGQVQRSGGRIRVDRLAGTVGLSPRQLRTLMHRELGIGPKTACRLARLDSATDRIVEGADRTLADTAVAAGYADHAHLDTEFRTMVGCSPSAWLAEERGNIDAGGHRTGTESAP